MGWPLRCSVLVMLARAMATRALSGNSATVGGRRNKSPDNTLGSLHRPLSRIVWVSSGLQGHKSNDWAFIKPFDDQGCENTLSKTPLASRFSDLGATFCRAKPFDLPERVSGVQEREGNKHHKWLLEWRRCVSK